LRRFRRVTVSARSTPARKKTALLLGNRPAVRRQSTGIAAAINLFNPQTVYIHSHLFDEIPDYLPRLREQVEQKAMAPSAAGCTLLPAAASKLKGTLLSAIDGALSETIAVD